MIMAELPEEFQRRDQRVVYAFEAPKLSDELAMTGQWIPSPGLRTIEKIEAIAIRTDGISIDPITPGEPALDPRGNEIPTSFRIERDPMGVEKFEIRFIRYLSRIDVCTGDLSMDFTLNRSVLVDLTAGGNRLFSALETLTFEGVNPQ